MTITIDGEPFKVRTKASDHTAAEVVTAKAGGSMETTPVSAGFRVAFQAFRRCYPESEYAASFARFLDALDDIESDEPDDETAGELDPTLEADLGGSP